MENLSAVVLKGRNGLGGYLKNRWLESAKVGLRALWCEGCEGCEIWWRL